MAGTVVIDVTAKDGASVTLTKINQSAKDLNKTFTDSRGKLRNAQGQFVKMGKSAGTARASFKALGATFSTYLAPLVAFGTAVKAVGDSLKVFSDRQKDTAALANGIKGMTTDGVAALNSLKKSADELGKATLFDEEDFTKGFKLLTSFKTIGVSSYEEVAGVAADMATVLDQDVNSTLLQVAKALEAPDVGLTALQRSGTRFTDQQKQQVKAMVAANKTVEAQAFILKELERQYGGASKAAATGFAGAMDTLGEVTRDAMEALGGFVSPLITKGINLLVEGVQFAGKFFNLLAKAVLPSVKKALEPLVQLFKQIFQKIDFEKIGNIIANVVVGSLYSLYEVASIITPVIAKIGEALFFMLENSPFGLMLKGIIAVAEKLGLTAPLMDEFAAETNNVKTAFDDIPPAVDAAVEAQKRKIEALKESVNLAGQEAEKVKEQEAAYENSVKVTDARLNAEAEINKMQNQGLQIAYENAKTAGQRLQIAHQIFQNEMEGARIAYQQTLNTIKAEEQRLQFRRQAAQIEAEMIAAKGKLAAAEAESAEKAQKIMEATREAVEVQNKNVQLLDGQIAAQREIGMFQKQAAEAQLMSARMTAEQNLKQKLVSDEIGMSEKNASALTGRLGEGAIKAMDLEDATGRVGANAESAAHMFIRVAENASSAANQISRAAAAQERLNRARARRSSSSSSSSSSPETAAKGAYWKGGFSKFAQGGVVNGPTLGLIGEGGEPEYIIPQSKAAGFAVNYLSGQRGAGAIPGFAEGGFVTPSVNIQTGPVTQMDGTNYVTQDDMQKAVKGGVIETLKMLQNDLSTRGRLGLI